MAPVEYRDFEIEIGPGQGREYPVFVIRSPAGEARETCRFPFDELALEGKLKDLQIAILRSGGARRVVLTSFETNVQDFGRALFDFLMTGEIRSLYDVSQREAAQQGMGLRLKLRIQPPELSSLPWEYLFDSRIAEYVCLSSQTPIVRYIELPKVIQPLKVVPPLRILGLNASPRGLATLDAENEKHRMGVALDNLVKHGQVTITWQEHTTWRDLQRLMRAGPWHIFHFIGHGGFNHLTEEGFIALEDDAGEMFQLPASLLARLIADHTALRLAILNSCDGAQGANTDVFSSSASLLVRRGLPAVLAMQYEITDRAAIEFARGFYEALADGLPVDAATSEARISVSLGVTNTIEWGTPALYMRTPDGVLFRPETSAEKANRLSIRRQQRQLAKKQATELRTHLAEKTEVINQVARQQSNPEIVEKSARERTEFQTQEKATSTQPEFETEKKTDIERTKLQSQEKITNKHVEHEASEKAAHESTELLTIPRDIPEKTTQDVHDELPVPTPIERQQHNKVYQDKTIRETKGKTNDDQHELDGQYFMSTAAKQTMASWSKVIEFL